MIEPSTPKAPPDNQSGPEVSTAIKYWPACVPLTGKAKTFPWKQFQAAWIPPITQRLPVLT